MLEIKDLWVSASGNMILKGINLKVNDGETIALMGPNGSGKSTLSYSVMGHPQYKIEKGSIIFNGEDITNKTADLRSLAGIFLAMQSPYEISGVTNRDFIKQALDKRPSKDGKIQSVYKFAVKLEKAINDLDMEKDLADRYVNEDFSGGEKKKNEILQMKMLEPKLSILDEIDSGLDVDAIKVVAKNINELKEKNNMSLMIISHYHRLYEYIKPDRTFVLIDGRIVKEGDSSLIDYIDNNGYDQIKREAGIEEEVELLETCAFNGAKK
ncbi:MAG: Fe-S cluster assembly ATPase SufC [Gammaproteobacteria bacterium]|nr:Fe-S cluster assembly ATPase SufC [Gammaproteobacteria bacterium]